MKKRLLIPYVLLAISLAITLVLFFSTNGLQQQLNQSKTEQTALAETIGVYQDLTAMDALVLENDYRTALKGYYDLLKVKGADSVTVQYRIQLAEKLKHSQFENANLLAIETLQDSSAIQENVTPLEIRRYDSLNFAHEKAKIQLKRLRNQLQQKSAGEYLTFKSKKGNQMHYVGQVKNHRANGLGIALLDSGSRYEGEWNNNERHGKGTYYWPDGEYYIGSYENDRRNGLGSYHWPNGEKYVGFWKDDKRNGQGEFYGADGNVMTSGTWKNDKLVETDRKERKARR